MSSTTTRYNTTDPYEAQFGYSRAVRRGPFIFISGTTSTSLDSESGDVAGVKILHPSSAYDQSLHIFTEITSAVENLGGKKSDITRVRMFVKDNEDTGAVGRALKECLGDVEPAATMIVGVRFVHEDMRVEIEADAVVVLD